MTNFFNIDEAHFTLLERSQKLNQFFLRGFQPVVFFDLFATENVSNLLPFDPNFL